MSDSTEFRASEINVRVQNGKTTHWFAYTDRDGKRRRKYCKTDREAKAERDRILDELENGTHTALRASCTVAKACEIYIDHCHKHKISGLRDDTAEGYDRMVRLHVVPHLGTLRLTALDVPRLNRFRDDLITKHKVSVDMAKRVLAVLQRVIHYAMGEKLIAQNVVRDVTRPKLVEAIDVTFDDDDDETEDGEGFVPMQPDTVDAILAAALAHTKYPDTHPFLFTACYTGMRVSELRGLRWPDVDFDKGIIKVRRMANRKNFYRKPKTKQGKRDIPLHPKLAKVLTAWKLACPGRQQNPDQLVFPNKEGKPISYTYIRKQRLIPVLGATGMARKSGRVDKYGRPIWELDYGMHDFRHYYASRLIAAGVEPKRLQVWMGHADFKFTMQVYCHLFVNKGNDQQMLLEAFGGAE